MGVPRLFPWLCKHFPRAVKYFQYGEGDIRSVDNLYLDANGLLHSACQQVYHYGQGGNSILDRYKNLSKKAKMRKAFDFFFENILEIVCELPPRKILYIAIDGPAPLAKQAQQRQRRFISARTRLTKLENDDTKSNKFDSNSITPGTIFMHELTKYIKYMIRNEMNTYLTLRNVKVYFSPPTVPGEGEHKIIDFIRNLPLKVQKTESHCLFGPDGDLIMLTLSAHIPKMFLFREDQYHPGFLHLIDMGIVRKKLANVLGQTKAVGNKERSLDDVSNDFIIEGFFVGNDFLPKIQMFHLLEDGLQFMLDTYSRTSQYGEKNHLSISNKFNIKGFKIFISKLAESEELFLIDQVTTSHPRKKPPEHKFINQTLKLCVYEKIAIGKCTVERTLNMKEYRRKYYAKANISLESTTPLNNLCFDYLKTMVWVFEYYVNGLPDWRWAFEHHYAPLMIDFNKYLQSTSLKELEKSLHFEKQNHSVPFVQLLSVLPPASVELLPNEYHHLMTDSNSSLVKLGYYPSTFKVDYEGKFKDYQGVCLLSFVNYEDIYNSYKKVSSKTKHNRNSPGKVMMFKYNENYTCKYTSDFGKILKLHIQKIDI